MADRKYLTVDNLTRIEIGRIFAKIAIDNRTGCWLWTGCLSTAGGYGKYVLRKSDERAHRILWAWLVGPLPRGLGPGVPQLDHFVCNNPRCCFPVHLRLVTPSENVCRTNGPSAINARKTHCKNGHPLPAFNNCQERRCRICYRKWERKRYARRRAERIARKAAQQNSREHHRS